MKRRTQKRKPASLELKLRRRAAEMANIGIRDEKLQAFKANTIQSELTRLQGMMHLLPTPNEKLTRAAQDLQKQLRNINARRDVLQ